MEGPLAITYLISVSAKSWMLGRKEVCWYYYCLLHANNESVVIYMEWVLKVKIARDCVVSITDLQQIWHLQWTMLELKIQSLFFPPIFKVSSDKHLWFLSIWKQKILIPQVMTLQWIYHKPYPKSQRYSKFSQW